MFCYGRYPKTDFHELDLDYVLKELEHFKNVLENFYSDEFDELLNKVFLNASYDEATKTITLTLDVKEDASNA